MPATCSVEKLRERYRQAKITALVLKRGFAELLENERLVDDVLVLDTSRRYAVPTWLKFLRVLRRRGPDLALTTFPANRVEYNVLAFLSKAPVRVAQKYPRKRWRTLSFLQNVRVPLQLGLHAVIELVHRWRVLGAAELHLGEGAQQFGHCLCC